MNYIFETNFGLIALGIFIFIFIDKPGSEEEINRERANLALTLNNLNDSAKIKRGLEIIRLSYSFENDEWFNKVYACFGFTTSKNRADSLEKYIKDLPKIYDNPIIVEPKYDSLIHWYKELDKIEKDYYYKMSQSKFSPSEVEASNNQINQLHMRIKNLEQEIKVHRIDSIMEK